MKIKQWFENRIQAAILSNVARGLAEGKYGPRLAKVYAFGKGYATWTGAALAMICTAAAQFDNSGASAAAAQACAVLAGLGLVRKGAHMEPPQLPAAMKDTIEGVMSAFAWLLGLTQAVVWLCSQLGASWACGVSEQAQLAAVVITALSGFLATYVADPIPHPSK